MAYRKVDESSLTQVANAIRNKAGTSARLNFPTGFANAIAAIPTGSGGITPTGTITITENGTHYVANYENANVALPEVEQATPSISVSSSGLITASVTQEAGVVPAGTETATKQLSTQGAKTVTPGTSNQTAVSSGRYTTGTVTVEGDANLVAGNIKKDVSIFGVTGTLETESAEQATPEITVSSGGLITATAGDKSATKQLSTQAAQTITPGTNNKTISSGKYLTGIQTIKGDTNLIASNIKEGVTIFDVLGTFAGGSSGGGLPSGISALASGTYTPTENKTTRVDVAHGLGVTPNFLVVMMEEDTSSSPLTSTLVAATVFFKSMKYNSSSSIQYTAHVTMEGYASSAQATGSATRAASNAYFTTTTVGIPCNSTYVLKSGYTYRWVCGVLDGIN